MSKRLVIDQKLCRKVKIMLDGGAKHKEIAELLGIGVSTIGRIRDAGFDAEVYQQNVEGRRCTANKVIGEMIKDGVRPFFGIGQKTQNQIKNEDEQVPGQLRMFMPEGGGTPVPLIDENKMMRFIAGQNERLLEKMDKINDTLCQILRRLDK